MSNLEKRSSALEIKLRNNAIMAMVITIMASTFLGQMFDNNLHIRHYYIDSPKVSNTLTIVLITDLHSCLFGENQSELIKKIKAQKPDIIALCGDIADDKTPIENTELMLNGIKDLAPIYYVLGNHEYWSGQSDEIEAIFESYGVKVLRDEIVEFHDAGHKLLIGGITDPTAKYAQKPYKTHDQLKFEFRNVGLNIRFSILLAHRPEYHEQYNEYGFDMVLCGHAHGGQVRIPPFINGLYAPNQGWFPERAGGIYYDNNGVTQIVSRGLSINPRLPRIFNPPEICVITVK